MRNPPPGTKLMEILEAEQCRQLAPYLRDRDTPPLGGPMVGDDALADTGGPPPSNELSVLHPRSNIVPTLETISPEHNSVKFLLRSAAKRAALDAGRVHSVLHLQPAGGQPNASQIVGTGSVSNKIRRETIHTRTRTHAMSRAEGSPSVRRTAPHAFGSQIGCWPGTTAQRSPAPAFS